MKLLFVSNLFPPYTVGGYERLAHEMAGALAERGHEIHVLTSDYGGACTADFGYPVERRLRLFACDRNIYAPFHISPLARLRRHAHNIRCLRNTISALRPERLLVWNLHFLGWPFLAAVRRAALPGCYFLTDIWLAHFLNPGFIRRYFTSEVGGQGYRPALRRRVAEHLIATALVPHHPLSGRAVFPSAFMRALYQRAGIRFADSAIVPHGVHLAPHATEQYADRVATIRSGELRLLFAGRVVDVKGVHTAIEALPAIVAALPGVRVRLTVLGDARDAPYQERLRALMTALAVESAVTFAPPVAEDALFAFFQEHDIHIFPSLHEPYSLTLLHALAAGIPTVASDAGGNPEAVRDHENGLVFLRGDASQLAAAVIELASQPLLRQRLAANAHAGAPAYGFGRMVEQIEALLMTE